jgi:cytochrome P450 family 33
MLQLENLCLDLWIAGLETTITTLQWGILHLLHNADVQQNIHNEIKEKIHVDRLIDMNDKNELPYTSAVINVTFLSKYILKM